MGVLASLQHALVIEHDAQHTASCRMKRSGKRKTGLEALGQVKALSSARSPATQLNAMARWLRR